MKERVFAARSRPSVPPPSESESDLRRPRHTGWRGPTVSLGNNTERNATSGAGCGHPRSHVTGPETLTQLSAHAID